MASSCNLLPAFLAGAWASILMVLVCIGAAYCSKLMSRLSRLGKVIWNSGCKGRKWE